MIHPAAFLDMNVLEEMCGRFAFGGGGFFGGFGGCFAGRFGGFTRGFGCDFGGLHGGLFGGSCGTTFGTTFGTAFGTGKCRDVRCVAIGGGCGNALTNFVGCFRKFCPGHIFFLFFFSRNELGGGVGHRAQLSSHLTEP